MISWIKRILGRKPVEPVNEVAQARARRQDPLNLGSTGEPYVRVSRRVPTPLEAFANQQAERERIKQMLTAPPSYSRKAAHEEAERAVARRRAADESSSSNDLYLSLAAHMVNSPAPDTSCRAPSSFSSGGGGDYGGGGASGSWDSGASSSSDSSSSSSSSSD